MGPRIRVPYVDSMLSPITAVLCDKYDDCEFTNLDGEYGYARYFNRLWSLHEDFINVEQDVIFWPGAIEALWACSEPWCAYGYSEDHLFPPNPPVLGCTKITTTIMDKVPHIWEHVPRLRTPIWAWLDGWLWQSLGTEYFPHQHFPYVINARG